MQIKIKNILISYSSCSDNMYLLYNLSSFLTQAQSNPGLEEDNEEITATESRPEDFNFRQYEPTLMRTSKTLE